MKIIKILILLVILFLLAVGGNYLYKRYQNYQNFHTPAAQPPSSTELSEVKLKKSKKTPQKSASTENDKIFLGINTADVREDTSSVQFLNLFKSAIPFAETVPWGSSKDVTYDKNGWPTDLNGGKAGTKFLNRLPEGTIEEGFFTVLYDGEGEIFYGNDARLIVHRPNRDVIEIKAGKDHTLNASLFIKKTIKDNYIRNIRILPEGGICEGKPHIKVKIASDCKASKYLSFDENDDKILFNPDYLNFMKDFQVIRFMNMSGMTRNPVENWSERNLPSKATWGGRAGLYSRGAPVEIMVALANQVKSNPWFSMPYKANDDYVRKFAKYVKNNLDPNLKAYIEYSNEVWNPIFIHHDYAIEEGLAAELDAKKSPAGYKWYSRRSVQVFKIWEDEFGGHQQLVRVLGSWASNQNMSSQILAFEDAYKHTDAVAIGPYVSAHPEVLREAENVNDVFKAMMSKDSKWGMKTIVSYINKQQKVANSFGVNLIAYEGGQHLVDWNTRKVEEHPNPLLYAANRDPRMGIVYDELMHEWKQAGGKLFVAFSAPRIYSWYGSWGIKEHIRQPRAEAPKYDSLLRYLDNSLHPEKVQSGKPQSVLNKENKDIQVSYAKSSHMIWDMSHQQIIPSWLEDNNPSDFSASWQANWDSKHLYFTFSVSDNDIQKGDELVLILDTATADESDEKPKKIDTKSNKVKTKNKTTQTSTKPNQDSDQEKLDNETSSDTNKAEDNEQNNKIEKLAKLEEGEGEGEESEKDENEKNKKDEEKEDHAKTFTFTPFDSLGTQTHLTQTDTGYLLNVAIPWEDIYSDKKTLIKTGNKIGINIQVTDSDEDEKGNKTLYWADTHQTLPKIILKHAVIVK